MESSSSRGSLRVPRARPGNRTPSARSSANLEDHRLSSSGPTSAHALRAPSSRFSLHEQFASTRPEFEFWDDDASSVYTRETNASEWGDPEVAEKTLVSSAGGYGLFPQIDETVSSLEVSDTNYYDILCLPQDNRELSQDRIRSAYYRLFLLFYPDSYPEHLRPIARQQFLRAQDAFETLVDPARRAKYDLDQFLYPEEAEETTSEYEIAFREAVRDRIQNDVHTSSDLGIRLDASGSSNGSSLQLLDFSLSHSVTTDLPALQKLLQPQVSRIESLASVKEKDVAEDPSQPTVQVATPSVTITGSTYGVSKDASLVPWTLFCDRYQPLLPLAVSRQKLLQLVENKLAPLITLRYRQEFLNRSPITSSNQFRWIKTAVELESDVSPEFSATSRLYHHFTLPNSSEPTIVEASAQSSWNSTSIQPRVALGLHRKLYHGMGFLRADSGNWVFGLSEHSRFFSNSLEATPRLELGFRTGLSNRVPVPGSSDSPCNEGGIRGLDYEVNSCKHGTWAVSASATPGSMAGFVRFSKNLTLPFQTPPTSLGPGLPPTARLETELCSNTFQDQYLAVRNLWSVGRFARLGLEVGISLHNLHLSVYWSRLDQRLSVPLLIAPRSLLGSSVLFWAGALPFAGLAALQLGLSHRRRQRASRSHRRARSDISAKSHVAIARRRYEADNITVLLAQPVEGRQKRQMALGGLVILSAKFGIPSEDGTFAISEQVADVTIALAALIEDSADPDGPALVIPRGVRKSRLPGFWDPAPGLDDKVLRVEYSFRGEPGVVEVGSRDELMLPPQA
ncbi:hypothetical protein F66182_6575 [Fusarium sp. NRRL 66182]|nr:hypothetical protein F66182_6575 [Fusarium sp. NRRL 66182]